MAEELRIDPPPALHLRQSNGRHPVQTHLVSNLCTMRLRSVDVSRQCGYGEGLVSIAAQILG